MSDSTDSDDLAYFTYGDMHQLILQGFMSAGYLDSRGVKRLFVGACHVLKLDVEKWTSMQAVQKVVREINENIKNYDMAIRSASCELSKRKFYVFLVTVEKPVLKLQTAFTKEELELFQKIMTGVLLKYERFAVPIIDCLNLARDIDPRYFSLKNAQAVIDKMVTMQYLTKYYVREREFEITLGIRAIKEFEPILRVAYDEIMVNCHLCKMIMLHGHKCPKCRVCVHRACYEKYTKSCSRCPGCKTMWMDQVMLRRMRQASDSPRGGAKSNYKGKRVPVLQPLSSPGKSRDKASTSSMSGQKRKRKSPLRKKRAMIIDSDSSD